MDLARCGLKPGGQRRVCGCGSKHGADLKVVQVSQAAVLAADEAPLVLIRPDQIVAWCGQACVSVEVVLKQVM